MRRPRHLTPLYLGPWLRILLQGTDGKGKVLAYEVPSEWATDTWTKHELADGYAPLHRFLPGQGSPGAARAFPVSNQSPHIIVTADDGGYVDMLVPTGAAFEYEKVTVIESTGTVGSPATGDVDGDGIAEVFGELLAGCQTLVPARPKPTAHHTMPLYRLPSPSSTPNPLLVARRPHPQPRHHQCLSTTSRGWLCTASEVCELAHARSLIIQRLGPRIDGQRIRSTWRRHHPGDERDTRGLPGPPREMVLPPPPPASSQCRPRRGCAPATSERATRMRARIVLLCYAKTLRRPQEDRNENCSAARALSVAAAAAYLNQYKCRRGDLLPRSFRLPTTTPPPLRVPTYAQIPPPPNHSL